MKIRFFIAILTFIIVSCQDDSSDNSINSFTNLKLNKNENQNVMVDNYPKQIEFALKKMFDDYYNMGNQFELAVYHPSIESRTGSVYEDVDSSYIDSTIYFIEATVKVDNNVKYWIIQMDKEFNVIFQSEIPDKMNTPINTPIP